MTDREYFIVLNSFIPFGSARTKLLVDYFGSAKKSFFTSRESLLEIGLSRNIIDAFVLYRESFDIDSFFRKLRRENINVLTIYDEKYPENMKLLDDAPPILYFRGEFTKNDTNSVAIVGSRRMTYYGSEVTKKFAGELAGLGITIVSGLAFGVDLEAHRSAINAGGRCIAVLASGVDMITPRSNEWLGKKILEKGGVIVSEYAPGVVPQKYFFPYRNRIISGLSKAVLVIEGMEKSGTIHTARHAADQGRAVFAVPGQITSPGSAAPHFLIKNGARMATNVKDILDELNINLTVDAEKMSGILPEDKLERKIYKTLETEALHVDEVARMIDLNVSKVSAKLTALELKGIVRNLGNGIYRKI